MTDHVADELSAYLDEELSPADQARVERHVAACAACGAELAELRRVAMHARALPDREPSPATADALWARIAAGARFPDAAVAPAAGAAVTPLVTRRRHTVTFSIPQLVAAGLVLALLSGGVAWQVLRGRARETVIAKTDTVRVLEPTATLAPAELVTPQYDGAVAELEGVLRENRGRLEPETARAIEQSLATIDRAIAEARAALARDPGNAYLNDHLAATMARKLELLRDVAGVTGQS
ncbi:MAG: anti-sigma factor family protein [Gemmatimonadaceae bacterium]